MLRIGGRQEPLRAFRFLWWHHQNHQNLRLGGLWWFRWCASRFQEKYFVLATVIPLATMPRDSR